MALARFAPGLSSNRALQVCYARFPRPQQNRPVAAFGQAATGRARNGFCALHGNRCPLARARFQRRPATRARRAGLRPALLWQVVRKRAVLDADDSPPVRHDGWFTDTPPGLAMKLPRHASRSLPQAAARGVLACRWGVGLARVRVQTGEAVKRRCRVGHVSFRGRRPVRPWLVVNPGGGAATPWASWPQPSSENNFPCAARIPRGTNSFRFQVLHVVATAARCDPPIPRRPDHNKDALARPWFTERRKHHG